MTYDPDFRNDITMALVSKLKSPVLITDELIADMPVAKEALALVIVTSSQPQHRFRYVWGQGYSAALEDIRAGRLVLRDGMYEIGPGVLREEAMG